MSCPSGWEGQTDEHFCYTYSTTLSTYNDAKSFCAGMDAEMVMPKTNLTVNNIIDKVLIR